MNCRSILILVLASFFFLAENAFAQTSLNKVQINLKNQSEYSFILLGHIYGSSENALAAYPSSSVLANINNFEELSPDFMILLGDIVREVKPEQNANLRTSFLDQFGLPIFNVPGNHDLADINFYTQEFGPDYQSFKINSEYFILLNTGTDSLLEESQKVFLSQAISKIQDQAEIKNVFIVGHRLYWLAMEEELTKLEAYTNGQDYGDSDRALAQDVKRLIENVQDKRIYFLAGDIGVKDLPSILFFKNQNRTYLANGVGDTAKDFGVLVKINEGRVGFEPIALASQEKGTIEDYSPSYWQNRLSPVEQNVLPQPGLTSLLQRKSYWAGLISGLLIGACALVIIKRLF